MYVSATVLWNKCSPIKSVTHSSVSRNMLSDRGGKGGMLTAGIRLICFNSSVSRLNLIFYNKIGSVFLYYFEFTCRTEVTLKPTTKPSGNCQQLEMTAVEMLNAIK